MGKANILYVDDEKSNLNTFKNTFRREYSVFTASSGKEGLDILKNNQIDVIITDQRMPGITGVEFLKKVLDKYPDPHRILLTGFTDFDAIREAINQGKIFQYVEKPWEKDYLRPIIDKAIDSYYLKRDNKNLNDELIKKSEALTVLNKDLKSEIASKNKILQRLEQSQEELAKGEKNLRLIYDAAGDVLFQLGVEANDQFRFLSVNKAFLTATGITENNIIGKTTKEVLPKESHNLALGKYKEAIKRKKIIRWQETSQYPGGTKVGNLAIAPVFDKKGNCTHLIGSVNDVTESKKVEIELRKYREKLEEIVKERTSELKEERDKAQQYLDIAGTIIILLDKDQNITLVNKKGAETLGFTNESEPLGLNYYDNFISVDTREERRQSFIELINESVPFAAKSENTIITKNGEVRVVAWQDVLVKDHKGEVSGMLISGEDVTIRRENEKKLREYTKELEMFNKSMLEREMRIIELKEEINNLAVRFGKKPIYTPIWENSDDKE